ncbi:5'-methylthioadenosine phosphorylase [Barrientosiimonas humi]|uniref:Purine nucleoside phosphorylase n=1 Tax=Barrientosiimonas humi TaxID=999931 RepID=A0A542XER8_9MICO|nr:S-methyl-5'-thioadenosine phosphorylase [Barrientosiimonas humi]TQL34320.1 5'-methylthioadenosine phosphorylase [Barrientosiimonas humi]CAG7574311.1 S-methyl-5'-thioadenosine phosphorylase [Barrientosiimonas humi]
MSAAAAPTREPLADIGVIGGSGFYSFLSSPERHRVETPFGDPSDEIAVGEVDGRRVAFLARHGQGHVFPPHRVNYRANLWALRSLGVRQVLAPCAVGSLRPEHGPGTLVVPDQVVDRTWGRAHTVYDEPGPVVHVAFADPYCPRGRAAVLRASAGSRLDAVDGGTLVVINGPRFSSRAESQWHRAAGWSVVGMTAMPEASVARELAMCYSNACLVTDHDAGVEGQEAVTHEAVLQQFARSIDDLKGLLRVAIARLPEPEPDDTARCACRRSLDGLTLPFELP